MPSSWSDLPSRVAIYGLGSEGMASLRACRARGVEPVLVDDNPDADSPAGTLRTEDGGLAAMLASDLVIAAPGVSLYGEMVRALREHGVPVTGGLALWLNGADLDRVLGVTGTKGKSTTTSIAAHLLRAWGYSVLLGGNIGLPPWDPEAEGRYDYWCVEVSSYQAAPMTVSPAVVVVTSLHPDHLPWHAGDVETYYRDKLNLCAHPGARLTLANGDSALLREHAARLGPEVEWVRSTDADGLTWIDTLGLPGVHNRRNALLALKGLQALGVPEASDPEAVEAAATGFQPLAHRLTILGEVDGVVFVDDSLSTNVLPTLAAVESFPTQRVALLVGGFDRGIDYAPLAEGLRSRTTELLLVTMPDSGARIAAEVRAADPGELVRVIEAESLADAVRLGQSWAGEGGVVLLSPAAPSHGIFHDYADRARAFVAAMRGLRSEL